jgi:dienelactone hydrolase
MHHRNLLLLPLLFHLLFPVNAYAEAFTFRSEVMPKEFTATIGGELSFPRGNGPFPVVILMHGCSGLHSVTRNSLQAHARDLVDAGFATFILDSFGPRKLTGEKVCGGGIPTDWFRPDDAFNAMRALQRHAKISRENIFLLGQSNGGTAALEVAQRGEPSGRFRAVAAFYPGCGRIAHPGGRSIVSPAIVFVGGKDDWTPPALCVKAKNAGTVTGAEFEVVAYPNAHHSFDFPGPPRKYMGYTLIYDNAATLDSRKKLKAFFIKHLTDELKSVAPFAGKAE